MNNLKKWGTQKLGDIIRLKYGKSLPEKKRIFGPYPVYGSSGIVDYHREALVSGPGIIVGRKGSIGNIYFESNDFFPIDTVFYVEPIRNELDLYFLSCMLSCMNLKNLGADTAVPGLNREVALRQVIHLPPYFAQLKIATILSAYDDLIENNLRRIKILEEMAQLIYKEWFVHFRFPGHENVKMVDSPLGEIPEGWEVKPIKETFDVLGGGTPSKKVPEYWNGNINWYTPSDLTTSGRMFMDESSLKITEKGLDKSSARIFPEKSVMMTSRATIGIVAINTTKACTNQGFITCIPNENYPLYLLYHWLKYNKDHFIRLSTGATFNEISKKVFKEVNVLVPPKDIVNRFEEAIKPIGNLILNLLRKNNNLQQTRDLLLPKLISGEIDVSDLDIDTRR